MTRHVDIAASALVVTVVASCAGTAMAHQFPERPPASIPDSLYAPENMVEENVEFGLPVVRNALLIWFDVNATTEQRAALVMELDGIVVGGARLLTGDGAYAVAIEDDGTLGPLVAAIALAERSEIVIGAGPLWLMR